MTPAIPMLVDVRLRRHDFDQDIALQQVFVRVKTLVHSETLTNPRLLDAQLEALEAAVEHTKKEIVKAQ